MVGQLKALLPFPLSDSSRGSPGYKMGHPGERIIILSPLQRTVKLSLPARPVIFLVAQIHYILYVIKCRLYARLNIKTCKTALWTE